MIFQVSKWDKAHSELTVARDKDWACLPAIRWGDDPDVNNVLPQVEPFKYGWYTISDDGALRQILRDPYTQPPADMNHRVLRTDEMYFIGEIETVGAKEARFKVLHQATQADVNEALSLAPDITLKAAIKAISEWRLGAYAALAFWNYRLYLHKRPLSEFKELVDKLPHGSGFNGNWFIDDESISITYTIDDGYGQESLDVGWQITRTPEGKWEIGEYIGDDAEQPEGAVDSDEWGLPEMERLIEDLAEELQEALNA